MNKTVNRDEPVYPGVSPERNETDGIKMMKYKKPGQKSGIGGKIFTGAMIVCACGFYAKDFFYTQTDSGIISRAVEQINDNLAEKGQSVRVERIEELKCRRNTKKTGRHELKKFNCTADAYYSDQTNSKICIEGKHAIKETRKDNRRSSEVLYTDIFTRQCGDGPDFSVFKKYR